MRIALVTNETLFAAMCLRRFSREQAGNVVAVLVTTRLPGVTSNRSGAVAIARESGMAYAALKGVVNAIVPRIARALGAEPNPLKQLRANGYAGEIRFVERADTPELCAWLRSLDVDVLLSAGATHKFNDELLAVPRHCAVNHHPSLLPRYRGVDPYIWCLFNGDAETGTTLHITAPKLDAGDIVAQRRVPTAGCRDVLELYMRLWDAANPMIADFFAGGADLSARQAQDESQRSFYKRPGKQVISALRRKGIAMMRMSTIARAVREAATLKLPR